MSLEIKERTNNGVIEIENYNSLLEEAQEIVKPYKTLIVDNNNIEDCKEIKTKLNKIIKTINDSRITSERKYMIPFNYGKDQYDSIIKVFQEAADNLKGQLDQVETAYKNEKRRKVKIIFETVFKSELILLDQIYNSKWDNHTYKLDTIENEIEEIKKRIDSEVSVLKSITKGNDLYEMLVEYYSTLDMAKAIEKLKARKELIEKIKNEIEKEGK